MTALDLLQGAAQITWVVLGAIALVRLIRRPTRANVDIALFFGALALVTVEGRVVAVAELPYEDAIRLAATIVVMAIPYLLVRVVHDFVGVRVAIRRAAEAGLAVSAVLLIAFGARPLLVLLALVAYFAACSIYSATRVLRATATSEGVTRQRLRAIGAGSYFLGIAILLAGLGIVEPSLGGVVSAATQVCVLASALSYAIGSAPPNALRRYWQMPGFRAFVARSAQLPRARMEEIALELESVAQGTLGGRAAIGLWDEERGVLRFRPEHEPLPLEMGRSEYLGWQVFAAQRALYVDDAARANPTHAEEYRRAGVGPILIAPISAGERRIGIIEVFAAREPIFVEDDLAFVELVAQQAAVLLESRRLVDDAARVRAVEEAARLKEDFVSAAAHDLKTPLTTILAQAQLLERRAERDGRTGELSGIRRLVRETQQLSRQVEELLDASRLERGALPMHPEPADLVEIVREVALRERPGMDRIELAADGDVRGEYDHERVRQLVDNLIENALKYSPAESPVDVRVWVEDGNGRLSVGDHGIGIPPEDVPHVFDRFRRGSNVDHRRFSGIGLGLYICRGIVEQHEGRIWVESAPGRGTTFHVALPLTAAGAPEEGEERRMMAS